MLKLLKQAKDEGVTEIIATPHHLSPTFNNENKIVERKLNEILDLDEVKEMGIKIYPGQEIRISDQIILQLEKGETIGLNHSKYLLIEFPSGGFRTIRIVFSLNYNQKDMYQLLLILNVIKKLVKTWMFYLI